MNDRHCCFYCICFFCMLCCTAVEKIFYRMALNCATQWGNLFSLGCEWSLTPGLVVTPTPTPGEGEEVHAASGQPEGARRGEDLHVLQTHVCSLQCGTEVRDTHTCEQCLCDRIHRHSLLSPSPLRFRQPGRKSSWSISGSTKQTTDDYTNGNRQIATPQSANVRPFSYKPQTHSHILMMKPKEGKDD